MMLFRESSFFSSAMRRIRADDGIPTDSGVERSRYLDMINLRYERPKSVRPFKATAIVAGSA